MKSGYEKQAVALNMNGSDANADAGIFAEVSEDELVKMGVSLISYFLHDEYVSRFRKMLTLEQFQNEELAKLFSNYMLLTLCDRQPEREPEALELLERHIRQFSRVYQA